MSDQADPVAAALAYHRVTKHELPNRYARSLGYLDWDNQPNPFRLYEGCASVALARDGAGAPVGPSLDEAYDPARVTPRPVDASSVGWLLYNSLALSAWKELGSSRWSLRCNPSSGNLHPTEAYVIAELPELGDKPSLWHYSPLIHGLERRASIDPALWADLRQDGEGVLVGLSSIHWREAWKYGERSFRYCQHDVGHAIAALAMAAAGLGWELRAQWSVDDEALARLLALPSREGPEAEHPDLLLFAGPKPPTHTVHGAVHGPGALALETFGAPNQLSEAHQHWPILDQVSRACARIGAVREDEAGPEPRPEPSPSGASLRHVVRTRRSAVAFDGHTPLSRSAFLRMLARTLPRPGHAPFASLLARPRVHLLVFVHRVEGLEPGLYLVLRAHPSALAATREDVAAAMHAGFDWTPIDSGELDLPLWRLERADTRRAAALVSCRQDIAADGAFAVAMLAELEPTLRDRGAWMYRHLHWEAGAIGHVLYLEAEAAGRRGTGIGCFFDDGVGEIIGVDDGSLASIYHFTVGAAVDDARLSILEAYHHLDDPDDPDGRAGQAGPD